MKLPKPIRKLVDKVTQTIDDNREADAKQARLEAWKSKLRDAMEPHESFRADCATYDALYGGTKSIRPLGDSNLYVSDRYRDDTQSTEDARQVVNVTFQLIESSIDVNLPVPAVEAREELDGNAPEPEEKQPLEQQGPENKPKPKQPSRRDMIEGQLAYMAADTTMRRINTENERIVKKNGIGFFKVGYNPNFKAHTYRGRIETTNPHPGNVVLQPGVFRIKDMDYMFHIENRTIDYVCRQYGEEFREQLEAENLEYGQLDYFNAGTDYTSNEKTKKLSVVEAWYKDSDGDVCLLTWVGDTMLREQPKFFYKRDDKGNIIEYDDVKLPTGETVKVKCHVPDYFSFVIWFNIPKEKSARGISDPYIIFDQQEGIKKLLSSEEKKQMEGTTKILARQGTGIAGKITNAMLQVIETPDPLSDVRVIDMKTPDNALKDLYYIYVQAAKDALGITEASQGRAENANLSGRALEQLAAQTQGRMGVKSEEKDIAYTELYRMWYDFLLAFGDSRMPYRTDGKDSKPIYGFWDKGLLVKQDDAGEWYYPEFDIYVQAETALPKDKRFILDIANKAGNRLDNVGYWMLMEAIGVPQASAILEMEQAKLQQQPPQPPDMAGGMPPMPEMQNALPAPPQEPMPGELPPDIAQLMQQLPPNMQQQIASLPPDQQAAFLMQLLQGGQPQPGGINPDQIQQVIAQLPPEIQAQLIQMLQTDPEQAMAMLQQIMQGQGGLI
jgi:hypothetical protein